MSSVKYQDITVHFLHCPILVPSQFRLSCRRNIIYMKKFTISLLLTSLFCTFLWQLPNPSNGASEEGYGVQPGSRKNYEYQRHHNPNTGIYEAGLRAASVRFASRLPRKQDRDFGWNLRGPYNKGGRTRALAIDKLNNAHIVSGGVTGGAWNSYNNGSSWSLATAPEQLHTVSCIAQDTRPGHEQTWYHGTGEEFYGVVSGTSFTSLFSGNGIFKSTDNGSSWQPLLSTTSNTPQSILQVGSYDFIWNIAIDHTNTSQDELYAAVYSGIIRSEDGGETWQQVLGFGATGQEFSDILITPSGVLYATLSFANGAFPGGYYRSTDGINWTEITPTGVYSQRRTVMANNPMDENEVYFLSEIIGTELSNVGHTLFQYNYLNGDGAGTGGTWDDRSNNLPDDPCELFIGVDFDFGTWRSQYSYDLCMTHHPTIDNMLYIGGINIHRSASAFANDDSQWIGGYQCNENNPIEYSWPNHHSDQHLMVFDPINPAIMYSANDGGVYRTQGASSSPVIWESLNNGYTNTQFYTVAMEQGQSTSDFIMGGMQDNGTWMTNNTDPLMPWHEIHADDGSYCAIPQGRNFVLTSSQSGRIYKKTIDSNGQLTGTRRIDPDNGPAQLFINPFLLDPFSHNDLYIAGNRTIWWLPNVNAIEVNGDYYTELDTDLWDNISESLIPTSAGSITTLDKALGDNTVIYYASAQGRVWRLDSVFINPTKTEITSDNFPTGAYSSSICVHDFDINQAMLSFSNFGVQSIFHTSNGGSTWENISGNLEENADGSGAGPAVYWVHIYPSETPIYFAGTSAGLFSTSALDGENTIWSLEGATTIGNAIINMIDSRPYDGKIIVGTHGRGVYSSSLGAVEAAYVKPVIESSVSVSVYPNPSSSQFHFQFENPSSTEVTLQIYDATGKEVYHKQQSNISPGRQSVIWNATEYPLGSYYYVLHYGKNKYTGKLIKQ
jgi:Secretion system C-terminal sorting domain